MRNKRTVIDTYLEFPVNVSWEFVSFVNSQVNAELVIDATTQLVLLNVNVETVGDVGAFSVYSNQFVIPDRYVVFKRSVEKVCRIKCVCFDFGLD